MTHTTRQDSARSRHEPLPEHERHHAVPDEEASSPGQLEDALIELAKRDLRIRDLEYRIALLESALGIATSHRPGS